MPEPKKLISIFKKSVSKNLKVGIIAGAAAIVVGLIIIYCVTAGNYDGVFLDGTTINGEDVSGCTAEEVENKIKEEVEDYSLKLTFRDGEEQTITHDDIELKYVSDGSITEDKNFQSKYAWILSKFGKTYEYTAKKSFKYDAEKLKAVIEAFPEMAAEKVTAPADASVQFIENAFTVVPEVEGNLIDEDKFIAALDEAINSKKAELNLDEAKCYVEPNLRSDDEGLNKAANSGNELINCEVTYQFPDGEERFTSAILKEWLAFDEASGTYTLSDETIQNKCAEYVAQLAAQRDTLETMNFNSTNYGTIKVQSKNFGFKIDQATEINNLISNIKNHETVTRQPAWEVEGEQFGIGNTYVEVDVYAQQVYVYKDGQLAVATDTVTGYYDWRDTVYGVYSIFKKQRDRVLEGPIGEDGEPSYSSFVYYWMPFYHGYGLHDATWRSEFGGKIYTYYGSHGCVNLPYDRAKEIYDIVEIGTPVIVFRHVPETPAEGTVVEPEADSDGDGDVSDAEYEEAYKQYDDGNE